MSAPREESLDGEGVVRDRRLRVLIADDNAVVRSSLGSLLRVCGYEVDQVVNGLETLECVRRHDYDVFLLDVQMPGMGGPETARALVSAVPQGRRPLVIAMSADASPEDRAMFVASGMSEFLAKPVRLAELLAVLRSVRPGASPSCAIEAPDSEAARPGRHPRVGLAVQ